MGVAEVEHTCVTRHDRFQSATSMCDMTIDGIEDDKFWRRPGSALCDTAENGFGKPNQPKYMQAVVRKQATLRGALAWHLQIVSAWPARQN
jgi:hypothetical protein